MRRLLPRLCVLVLACLCVGLRPILAQSTPTAPTAVEVVGTVTGRVTNGTAASTLPAALRVTLVIRRDGQSVQELTTEAGPDGAFRFEEVPIRAGDQYAAAVAYRDRVFSSAFVSGDPANPSLDLPIIIFELTEDTSVLSIIATRVQISAISDRLEFRQIVRFRNHSDRAFTTSRDVGDGRFASVVVNLPPGAQVISLDDDRRYLVSDRDFAVLDTAPVFPGDSNIIVVVYILPYDGRSALIEQPFSYPFTGTADLLLWPETLRLTSQQLAPAEPETLEGRPYNRFTAEVNLKPGDVLRYELSGASAAGYGPSAQADVTATTNNILLLLTGLIVLSSAAVALLVLLRGRSRPTSAPMLIDALNRQLADLDQRHAAGQLNHDLWHRQRAPLLARLHELRGEDTTADDDA